MEGILTLYRYTNTGDARRIAEKRVRYKGQGHAQLMANSYGEENGMYSEDGFAILTGVPESPIVLQLLDKKFANGN